MKRVMHVVFRRVVAPLIMRRQQLAEGRTAVRHGSHTANRLRVWAPITIGLCCALGFIVKPPMLGVDSLPTAREQHPHSPPQYAMRGTIDQPADESARLPVATATNTASESITTGRTVEANGQPVDRSESIRTFAQLAVGKWETFRDGKRELDVRADGTATMTVNLENHWKYVVGERLRLEIEWQIDGDQLTLETVGGEPQAGVDVITATFGKRITQSIQNLTPDELILEDIEPGSPPHRWRRVRNVNASSNVAARSDAERSIE